jgi:hypothetical protein
MSSIKLFESKKMRSQWDTEQEKWYFSVVDVMREMKPLQIVTLENEKSLMVKKIVSNRMQKK